MTDNNKPLSKLTLAEVMEFYGPLMLAGRKGNEFCSLKGSKIPFLLKSLRGGVNK